MRWMIRLSFLGLLLLSAVPAPAAERDAKADKIGKEMIDALGGQSAWEKTRELKFDFVVQNEGKVAGRRSTSGTATRETIG